MENCRAIIPPNLLFLLLLLLFLSFLCLPLCEAICYYPDGETIAPQDVPCQNGPGDSVCCGPGYACLSNGLCMSNNATHDDHSSDSYVRGSCTDKRWRSSACPAFCIGPKDNTAGGEGVLKCENSGVDSYCCIDGSGCDCDSGKSTLSFFGTPTILTTIGVTSTTASSRPTSSLISTRSSSTSATRPSSTISPTGAATSSTSRTSARTLASANAASSAGLPTPVVSATAGPRSDSALKVGLGVGIPLGVIACILAAYLVWQRKRHNASNSVPSLSTYRDKPYQEAQPPVYRVEPSEPQELASHNDPRELPTHSSPR